MILKSLSLENFRTYSKLHLDFCKNINIIYGENGIGKTNILEAIYLSCITKSYRVKKDIECLKFDENMYILESIFELEKKSELESVQVYLEKNTALKKVFNNKIKVNKYTEFIGKFPVVLFSPDSMQILKGSPKERRKFVDILLSQISKKYVIMLSEYKKILEIKNTVIKQDRKDIDFNYLDILDSKLAVCINEIVKKRDEYLKRIFDIASYVQKSISNGAEELAYKYQTDFLNLSSQQVFDLLKNNRDIDLLKKTSTKGVGHDDILVYINGNLVNLYGSQGQNRTAVLSMKIAELEILNEEKDVMPIILLDDVFSELDDIRIKYLLQYVSKYQAIITTTSIDNYIEDIKNLQKDVKCFKVASNGVVKPIEI